MPLIVKIIKLMVSTYLIISLISVFTNNPHFNLITLQQFAIKILGYVSNMFWKTCRNYVSDRSLQTVSNNTTISIIHEVITEPSIYICNRFI